MTSGSYGAWLAVALTATSVMSPARGLSQQAENAYLQAGRRITLAGSTIEIRDVAHPVSGVRIDVLNTQTGARTVAYTDDSGHFGVSVSPGRLLVSASKSGFAYAKETEAFNNGVILDPPAEDIVTVEILLQRSGSIAGVVVGDDGAALSDVPVFALDVDESKRVIEPRPGVNRIPMNRTDSYGRYRLAALPLGEYLVVAFSTTNADGATPTRSLEEIDEVLKQLGSGLRPPVLPRSRVTTAPLYAPGTPYRSQAARLNLSWQSPNVGVDIAMRALPVVALSGRVVGLPYAPDQEVDLSVDPEDHVGGMGFATGLPRLSISTSDGVFRYDNVVAGRYSIYARVRSSTMPFPLYGAAMFTVDAHDIDEALLPVGPGPMVSGQLRIPESSHSAELASNPVKIVLTPSQSGITGTSGRTQVGAVFAKRVTAMATEDGSFQLGPMPPGVYRVSVEGVLRESLSWEVVAVRLADGTALSSNELRLTTENKTLVVIGAAKNQ